MDVTLHDFDGCPNWQLADDRLREGLVRAGRTDARVEHRRVATLAEAEAAERRGSPTVLIDGREPFADPRAPVGLSCRVGHAGTGSAGAPTVEQLAEAMS